MPTKILSSSPYVNTLSAKQIVNFQRKALANRQISQDPSLLQSNTFTTNPIELEIQKFVNLSQKIVNDVEYLNSTIDYHSKSSTIETSTPLRKRVEMEQPPPVDEDPFLNYQEIYRSPFEDEPIMATPV
jgi:hypothetical protein